MRLSIIFLTIKKTLTGNFFVIYLLGLSESTMSTFLKFFKLFFIENFFKDNGHKQRDRMTTRIIGIWLDTDKVCCLYD